MNPVANYRTHLIAIVMLATTTACRTVEPASEALAKADRSDQAPCVSMPVDRWKTCGCHPRVGVALDILQGSGMSESSRAHIERCVSGEADGSAGFRGKKIASVEGALRSCIVQKIEVNDKVMSVVSDIASELSKRPPSGSEMCNWSRCVYGPSASCGEG